MTQPDAVATFDLPARLDSNAAFALVAELNKLSRSSEIRLNAGAVTSVSLGYLQILISAFKTFPRLGVADASAEFTEAFAEYGIHFPEAAAVAAANAPGIPAAAPQAPPAAEPPPRIAGEASPLGNGNTSAREAGSVSPPAVVASAPDGGERPAESGSRTTKTILTIDDSRTMRDMLKMALGGAGFTVIQAVDGQDGLNALSQQPVDLIITDINMPKLDGFGVIRAVRGDPAYNDTPILVLSTESEQESKDVAKDAGATGWIVKPFDPAGLVKVVNTVCGQ